MSDKDESVLDGGTVAGVMYVNVHFRVTRYLSREEFDRLRESVLAVVRDNVDALPLDIQKLILDAS